jgi:hypothetical protein
LGIRFGGNLLGRLCLAGSGAWRFALATTEIGHVPACALELKPSSGNLLTQRCTAARRTIRQRGVTHFLNFIQFVATRIASIGVDWHARRRIIVVGRVAGNTHGQANPQHEVFGSDAGTSGLQKRRALRKQLLFCKLDYKPST